MEYMYSWKNKTTISHKKRTVFYIELCNNKLFDCHRSDSDRIYFIQECKKKDAASKAKRFTSKWKKNRM